MIVQPIIAALILALLITIVFSLLLKDIGRTEAGIFFLILFFVMWAGSLWLNPVGPYIWGISWLPLLFIGVLFALLLSIAKTDSERRYNEGESKTTSPNPRDGEERNVVTVSEKEHRDAIAISLFFWALMAVLIIAIIAGYLVN